MSAEAKWSDLSTRIASAALLILVGSVELYIGGWPFSILIWIICGLTGWEVARMCDASAPAALGFLASVAIALAECLRTVEVSLMLVAPILLACVLAGIGQVKRDRAIFGAAFLWVLVGCYAILKLRHVAGLDWVLWLVAVVVVSDMAGYFAGRSLGGPKFWPRISPKKTWSGTIAGWLGAGATGAVFSGILQAGWVLVPVSILVALAGQMGDIAESALKRRCGVKDSSALIPGHGGVFDRFDAMLGAGVFVILLWALALLPGLS